MKLKEMEKKENIMLDSTRYKFSLSFDGATPSRTDISSAVAKAAGAKPAQVSIEKVYAVFGKTAGYVTAMVYGNDESKKLAEQDHLAQRIAKAEKAQADAKAKADEAKKAESPKEASKEEAKESDPEAKKADAPKPKAKDAPAEEKKPAAPKEAKKE
ncbi:MAG: hypothetical protein GXP63_05265 [DPANN group archaeon]|nr:hypothetical protein [DPANN group archaeon]